LDRQPFWRRCRKWLKPLPFSGVFAKLGREDVREIPVPPYWVIIVRDATRVVTILIPRPISLSEGSSNRTNHIRLQGNPGRTQRDDRTARVRIHVRLRVHCEHASADVRRPEKTGRLCLKAIAAMSLNRAIGAGGGNTICARSNRGA